MNLETAPVAELSDAGQVVVCRRLSGKLRASACVERQAVARESLYQVPTFSSIEAPSAQLTHDAARASAIQRLASSYTRPAPTDARGLKAYRKHMASARRGGQKAHAS